MTDAGSLPESFWTSPAFAKYVKPPLTPEVLRIFEDEFRVRLPASLVRLLEEQNGGYTDWTFPSEGAPDVVHEMVRGIGPGFPRLEQQAWWQRDEDNTWVPADPTGLIPFDGDGHWDLCLDYRGAPRDQGGYGISPKVTVIDCELRREEPVADSFDGYLARVVHRSTLEDPA
ncbi:SMI1/KNR4 family protein [Pedococcus sp. P5_B7]